MLINPIAHAQVISDDDSDWVWLCTGSGYHYVNFNADSDEEPPESPPQNASQLSRVACSVYDAAPEPEIVLFYFKQISTHILELPLWRFPDSKSFSYYSSRAPPLFS